MARDEADSTVVVFGKKIAVKARDCDKIDIPGRRIEPAVNVFVKITGGCNAMCPFCSNAGFSGLGRDFDLGKLVNIVRELRIAGVSVNKLNVTGGEPSIVPDIVGAFLETFSAKEFLDIHLHLNTNAVSSEAHKMIKDLRWDSVSISMHHYDMDVLSKLYGVGEMVRTVNLSGADLSKVNFSCNLIRGFVDSPEEVHRMLDFAVDCGVPRIGFVALMKVNDYCRDHFIDINSTSMESIPKVHFIESRCRGLKCKCTNYLYSRGGKMLEVYMRNYADPCYCESSLVYDGQHLRQGFGDGSVLV